MLFFKNKKRRSDTMDLSDSERVLFGGLVLVNENCHSLGELFLKKLKEHGKSVLLVNALTGEQLTASKLRAKSIQLAESLKIVGFKPGDQIATCCENNFEYVYVLMASIYLGVTVTPMNVDYTDGELTAAITLSKPRFIFASHIRVQCITELCQKYSFVESIIDVDGKFKDEKVISYRNLVNIFSPLKSKHLIPQSVDMSRNVSVILRTSGTTSCPKSIQMTQLNILCTVLEYSKSSLIPDPLVFTALPWVRAFGFRLLLRHIYHNVKTIFLPQFEKHDFLRSIEKFQPNIVNLYVTTMDFLAYDRMIDGYDLSSIKVLFTSSAPQNKKVKNALIKRLDIPMIVQGYGMSELSSIADQTETHCKSGSVGKLRNGILGKVVDIESGNILGPYERGEFMFTGPNLMLGYLGNHEANEKALTNDGWFHTGDYGYYDSDDEWFLVDRLKDLIRSNGKIISPAEIESILLDHPKVLDAAVIGIPEEQSGEIPFAFVECSDDQIPSEELIKLVRAKSNNNGFNGIRLIDRIPRDPAGKASKLTLRKMVENL